MKSAVLPILSVLVLVSGFSLVGMTQDSQRLILKYDSSQQLLLRLRMTPIGGKIIIKTGGRGGELEVDLPIASGATLKQDGNRITIVGQKQPSVYTIRIPSGKNDVEAEINGKSKNVRGNFTGAVEWDID